MDVLPVTPRAHLGFTLVEMLIGMAIGMIVALVMFHALFVAESEARANMGGANAHNKGSLALYLLERDLRAAGYGMNGDIPIGCTATGVPPSIPDDVSIVPIRIDPASSPGLPVTLRVTSGSSRLASAGYHLEPTSSTTSTSAVVKGSRHGIELGDATLLSEPGKPCAIAIVTGLPEDVANPTLSRTIEFDTASSTQYGGSGGRITNLGPNPTSNVYRVTSDHRLVVRNGWSDEPEREVATGVYGLLASYGRDSDGDGTLEFGTTSPTTEAEWRQVTAVKVALLIRSEQKEKRDAALDECNRTTSVPAFEETEFDLTDVPDWKCFEFRLFHTVVPLRNSLWRP